jgi:hypothetical protein
MCRRTRVTRGAPLQLQISALDYSTFVGRIGVGRINAGTIKPSMDVLVMEGPDGKTYKGRINQVLKFQGLDRMQTTEAGPGDIVLINGIENLGIGVTITDPANPQPLPMLKIDEPTLTMNFCVNTSPLAGREGKYVTSRQIWDRLQKELQSNVALRVSETKEDGVFEVMGRGELHLTILLENMRREGYELAVSKPRVVFHDVDGEKHEPIEMVTADVEEQHQGGVMQALGERKGELVNMEPDGHGRVRLEYRIPARGLIGFSNEFMNLTRGSGLISNIFDGYEPHRGDIAGRKNGVLISMDAGEIFTYALGKLDDRGRMFVKANDPGLRGHDRGHPQPRQRPGGQRHAHQAADQLPRQRQGRRHQDHPADRPDAGVRVEWSSSIRLRRRTGRDHAQEHPPGAQTPPGLRAALRGLSGARCGGAGRAAGRKRTAEGSALLVMLGVVQLAIPCVLAVAAGRVLKAPEAALLGLLEIIFGVAWTWLGGNESPTAAVLGGGGLVLLALAGNEAVALWRASPAGRAQAGAS